MSKICPRILVSIDCVEDSVLFDPVEKLLIASFYLSLAQFYPDISSFVKVSEYGT